LEEEIEEHVLEIDEVRRTLARRTKNLQIAQKKEEAFEKLNNVLRRQSSELQIVNSKLENSEMSLREERDELLKDQKKTMAEIKELKVQQQKERSKAQIATVNAVKHMNMLTAADQNIKALRLDLYNRAKENITVRAKLATISKAKDMESDKMHELMSLRENNKSLEKITKSEQELKQTVFDLERKNEVGLGKQFKFESECKELRNQISRLMCDQKISSGYLEQAMQTAIEKRILEQKTKELEKISSGKTKVIDELTADLKIRTKEIADYEKRLRDQEAELISIISKSSAGKNEHEGYLQDCRQECETLRKKQSQNEQRAVSAERRLEAVSRELILVKKSCAHYQDLLKMEREANSEKLVEINKNYQKELDVLNEQHETDRSTVEMLRKEHEQIKFSCIQILKVLLASENLAKSSFICPQCKVLFRDPVTCQPCGHSFCDNCIHEFCPMCEERVSYFPNDVLLTLTAGFKERFHQLTVLNEILEVKTA